MDKQEIMKRVDARVSKIRRLPVHRVSQASMVAVKSQTLMESALAIKYGGKLSNEEVMAFEEKIVESAIDTIATSIRLLQKFEYSYVKSGDNIPGPDQASEEIAGASQEEEGTSEDERRDVPEQLFP